MLCKLSIHEYMVYYSVWKGLKDVKPILQVTGNMSLSEMKVCVSCGLCKL